MLTSGATCQRSLELKLRRFNNKIADYSGELMYVDNVGAPVQIGDLRQHIERHILPYLLYLVQHIQPLQLVVAVVAGEGVGVIKPIRILVQNPERVRRPSVLSHAPYVQNFTGNVTAP